MENCAVILAAGLSSRMGAFKPLLKLNGRTMIERVYHTLTTGGCRHVVIVTGYHGDRIRAAFADKPVIWAENPAYATTDMLDSLRLGLMKVPESSGRILVTPTDIPLFSARTVQTLLALPETIPAAVPFYGGKTGHPILLSAKSQSVIAAYQGDCGLAGALRAGHIEPVPIPVADEGILYDADRPEEFLRLQQMEAARLAFSGTQVTAPSA